MVFNFFLVQWAYITQNNDLRRKKHQSYFFRSKYFCCVISLSGINVIFPLTACQKDLSITVTVSLLYNFCVTNVCWLLTLVYILFIYSKAANLGHTCRRWHAAEYFWHGRDWGSKSKYSEITRITWNKTSWICLNYFINYRKIGMQLF